MTLLSSIGAMVLLTSLWIAMEYYDFKVQALSEKEAYLSEKRTWLRSVVENTVGYIHNEYMRSEEITRQEVKARVLEGADIVGHLYETYGSTLSRRQMENLAREALRPIRFFNGRGYFFAVNLDGTEELYADKPFLEGQRLGDIVDSGGRNVVPEMLDLARRKNEGFYEYTWSKPDTGRDDHPKVAYLKLLPELGWVLGSGEYLEDVEKDQQEKTLQYLSRQTIAGDGSLFGGTWDGVLLLGQSAGQSMIDSQDANGLHVVRELIKRAKAGGGFLEYVLPPKSEAPALTKLSYVAPVPEWQWYIGYGVSISEIEDQVASMRVALMDRIRTRVFYIVILCSLLVVMIMLTSRNLARRFAADHHLFMEYFQHSALEGKAFDVSALKLEEYRHIASELNEMIARKSELDMALNASLDERSALLKEVHHRVKNNFQTVASLLAIQLRQCEQEDSRAALQTAHDRIYSMAMVHNLFYRSEQFSSINLHDYVESIVQNIIQSQSDARCSISVDLSLANIELSLDQSVPLGLLINELLTNSFKHAFAARTSGTITLTGVSDGLRCNLAYADDGRGFDPSAGESAKGLGMELIQVLAQQLRGDISFEIDNGSVCRLSFPLSNV